MPKYAPLASRFWSNVEKTEGCWNWTAGTSSKGYGVIHASGRQLRAHRVSWEMHSHAIPNGLFVCHHCDNPRCVRPDHLWLGTTSDNMRDASGKSRIARGERNGASKLAETEVREIRDLYATGEHRQRSLAVRYGVTQATISHIVRGEQWAYLGRGCGEKNR